MSALKRLILVRHAHRDKPFGQTHDNGLSPYGDRQAIELVQRLKIEIKKTHKNLESLPVFSSPKKRCVETVKPLAEDLKVQVQVRDELDEGEAVRTRAKAFLRSIDALGVPVVVACSHGDWIPDFVSLFCEGISIHIEKAGYAVLEPLADDLSRFDLLKITGPQ